MKQYLNIIKNSLCFSFMTGSCIFMIPNNLTVKIDEKKINRINLPLLGGLIGITTFIFSPILMCNYFLNSSYFDKLYDKLCDKYDIDIKRYHQFDGNDNKYAYPSNIIIEINKKEL